jgi:RHS repeat-associated protein
MNRNYLLALFVLLAVAALPAQTDTGTPPFSAIGGGPDVINLGNLNSHFAVPFFVKPGRAGLNFSYVFSYDSSIWSPVTSGSTTAWQPLGDWGWRGNTEVATGYLDSKQTSAHCPGTGVHDPYFQFTYSLFNYHDAFGVSHKFLGTLVDGSDCPTPFVTGYGNHASTDGSGYTLNLSATAFQVTPRTGGAFIPPSVPDGASGSFTDSNGNQITASGSGSFTDTLGMTALSITGTSPAVFHYTDSNATAQSITVNYSTQTVHTNFGCSGVSEYGPSSVGLVSSIVLADGSSYSFQYEDSGRGDGSVTGRMKQITLRTGGTIQYTYTNGSLSGAAVGNGIVCADGSTPGLDRVMDGGTWHYKRSGTDPYWTTVITSPAGNDRKIDFTASGTSFYPTTSVTYQGSLTSGTILASFFTCYNGATTGCASSAISAPITQTVTNSWLNTSNQAKVDTRFDSLGRVTDVYQYDFGASGFTRHTVNTYSGAVQTSTEIRDHTDSRMAYTSFGYDQTTPGGTSGVPSHVAVSGSRGNLTTVSQWISSTGGTLSSTMTYDDTGNLLTTTDSGGHTTSYGYNDNFSDSVNRNSLAYVTQATQPSTSSPGAASHVTHAKYDANTGLLVDSADENNNHTSYTYDAVGQVLAANFPDGGQSTMQVLSGFNYRDFLFENKIDSSRTTVSYLQLDAYGRRERTADSNDEPDSVYDQQDRCYDSTGQLSFSSYSYHGIGWTGHPKSCSIAGDNYTYDGAGRQASVTHSDGTSSVVTYNNRAVQISDEGNGTYYVTRINQFDSYGNLASVCEVSSSTLSGLGGTPASCGLDIGATGFLTSYSYDDLGRLTQVTQGSLNARQYQYDGMSRLTSQTQPESGQTTYTYNSDGLLYQRTRPAPNQASTGTATVTATYTYDELHRLRGRSYSDGTTPSAVLEYDQSSYWGQTLTNPLGRLTNEYNYIGSTGFTQQILGYDSMGRVKLNEQSTHPGNGFLMNYTYDLLGNVATATNGASVTFTNSYNAAGRLTSLASSLNDSNHPGTLLSNVHYGPFGRTAAKLGNGLLEQAAYQPTGELRDFTVAKAQTTTATNTVPVGTIDRAVNAFSTLSTLLPQNGTVLISGWAADNEDGSPIAQVKLYLDGNFLGNAITGGSRTDIGTLNGRSDYNNSGWTFTGTIGAIATGTHTVTAMIYDWAGNPVTLSATPTITVTAENQPIGSLESAQDHTSGLTTIAQGGTLDISGWAASPDFTPGSPVNKVELRIDGILQGTATLGGSRPDIATAYGRSDYTNSGWSGSFTIGNLAAGTHYVTATAYDSAGAQFTPAGRTITVTGSNPSISPDNSTPIRYAFNLNFVHDGNIISSNDSVNGSYAYSYDQFNRVLTSSTAGTAFAYGYDRYGNRMAQNLTAGQGPAPSLAFDANNRVVFTGVTHDPAGNITNDGAHSYAYDAENRLISVDGGAFTFVYDVDGKRTAKVWSSDREEYLYDLAGHPVTWLDGSGSWTFGEIYAGDRHLATYSGGETTFLHSDWTGTPRVRTVVNGDAVQNCWNLPFGDGANCTGSWWGNSTFGDYNHDNESNTEHSLARQYGAFWGRFTTADPYDGSMDLNNPQSLNRYAYVNGSPVSYRDRLGLEMVYFMVGDCIFGYDSKATTDPDTGAVTVTAGPTEVVFCSSAGTRNAGSSIDGGGGRSANGQNPTQCAKPNIFQSAAVKALSYIAKSTGRTVGYGVGGSIGAGKGTFGFNFSGSRQLVVAPDGSAGLATTYTKQIFGVSEQGAAGVAGVQVTTSTVQNVNDLQGYAIDFGAAGGDGLGAGFDGAVSIGDHGFDLQATGTLGVAFGAIGRAGQLVQTIVTPFCKN